MEQREFDFQPGLTEQFPAFKDCIKAAVYSCGRPFKLVAADLDMTVSELSRKLSDNPSDPVHFPLDRLPDLIAATGSTMPVMWLMEQFLEAPAARRTRVIDELSTLLPKIAELVKTAKIDR